MGLQPTQGYENSRSPHRFVISTGAKRSGEICGFRTGCSTSHVDSKFAVKLSTFPRSIRHDAGAQRTFCSLLVPPRFIV
jgi:hypothetical protein